MCNGSLPFEGAIDEFRLYDTYIPPTSSYIQDKILDYICDEMCLECN